MKKTYISPTVRAIQLSFEGMIADSVISGIQVDPENVKMGGEGGDYLSNRRNSIWGDED